MSAVSLPLPPDLQLAELMRNVLGAVDAGELRRLLERSAEEAHEAAVLADHDAISTSAGAE